MTEPLRLRIVSDGTPMGTTISDVATGRELHAVKAAFWRCDPSSLAVVTLELMDVQVDLVGVTEQEK